MSRRIGAIVVGAALCALLAASLASAGSTRLFAIGKPVCAPHLTTHITCHAMRRVVVSASTPGAQPFVPGAGAIGPNSLGPNGGLTPADFAAAYAITSTATPATTQTIAIVDAYNDPNIKSDLTAFSSHYGLLACTTANGCFKVVNQTGATSPLPPNDTTGWSGEETLDVEAVHSICQKCKIVLIEATSPSNANLTIAENTAVNTIHATEVSNSFGEPEQYTSASFQSAFNHSGTVIVASSGDDGYYDFDKWGQGSAGLVNHPAIPAAYPTVVAVGGTSLILGQGNARVNETVWNDNGLQDYAEYISGYILGAGGGGCSTTFAAQSWQTSATNWAKTACGTKRLVNDVSAVADYLTGMDIYDTYNCGSPCGTPGWQTIGGTSLAAPVIAAMFGLAGGSHGVAYPAQTLYSHASSAYDVKTGGNGWCDGIGAGGCANPNQLGYGIMDCAYTSTGAVVTAGNAACDAMTGFDGPSGVGSPKGLAIFTP